MALNFDAPDSETAVRLLKAFPNYKEGFVRIHPGNLMMNKFYQKDWETYYNFKIREDDIFVLSFPKSGTTWTQEMVWLIGNDCNFEGAKTLLRERVPFLEDRSLGTDESLEMFLEQSKNNEPSDEASGVIIEPNFIDALSSPRYIKSHLPFSCLPPTLLDTCRCVYVARNPKDVAVSWFNHHQMDPLMETTLNFEEFVQYFMRDEVLYSPYWTNLIGAWNNRHRPNFLFLFYEDMKMDLPKEISRVAKFFNKEFTNDQIETLAKHLGFDSFKNNPAVNGQELQAMGYFKKDSAFIRKGVIGDWVNYFSDELNLNFDQWIDQHLKDTDLRFPGFHTSS